MSLSSIILHGHLSLFLLQWGPRDAAVCLLLDQLGRRGARVPGEAGVVALPGLRRGATMGSTGSLAA